MRNFVLFLVIVNLGILAYYNQDALLGKHKAAAKAEIMPDKMHLLTEAQLDRVPLISDEAATTETGEETINTINATLCFDWGTFTSGNIKKAQSLLKKLKLDSKTTEKTTGKDNRYWVYLPPQKNAQAAQQKAKQFKALGVNDLFVLQGDKWKNAISFGVFEDGQLAEKLLKSLKSKGIKGVVKKRRSNGTSTFTLELKDVTEDKAKVIRAAKSKFPKARLKATGCSY